MEKHEVDPAVLARRNRRPAPRHLARDLASAEDTPGAYRVQLFQAYLNTADKRLHDLLAFYRFVQSEQRLWSMEPDVRRQALVRFLPEGDLAALPTHDVSTHRLRAELAMAGERLASAYLDHGFDAWMAHRRDAGPPPPVSASRGDQIELPAGVAPRPPTDPDRLIDKRSVFWQFALRADPGYFVWIERHHDLAEVMKLIERHNERAEEHRAGLDPVLANHQLKATAVAVAVAIDSVGADLAAPLAPLRSAAVRIGDNLRWIRAGVDAASALGEWESQGGRWPGMPDAAVEVMRVAFADGAPRSIDQVLQPDHPLSSTFLAYVDAARGDSAAGDQLIAVLRAFPQLQGSRRAAARRVFDLLFGRFTLCAAKLHMPVDGGEPENRSLLRQSAASVRSRLTGRRGRET